MELSDEQILEKQKEVSDLFRQICDISLNNIHKHLVVDTPMEIQALISAFGVDKDSIYLERLEVHLAKLEGVLSSV